MIIKSLQDEIQQYLFDQANLIGVCDKVFIVENTKELVELLKKANEIDVAVTVCGNHTSLNGSSLPESGWVVSTEKLNSVLEVNKNEKYIIVEPGITLKAVQEFVKGEGLFFPPDPTEDSCFIGGMIGTNASGARSFKYGATRNSVDELEVVLPTGELITISRESKIESVHFVLAVNENKVIKFEIPTSFKMPDVKNAAGYYLKNDMHPIDLFIGAEGTLGVVTKAKLKLRKISEQNISMIIFFSDIEHGFIFLERVRGLSKANQVNSKDVGPRSIEFYDSQSLSLLRSKFSDIPSDATCAFWIDQECDELTYDALFNNWVDFLVGEGVNLENIWLGVDERDKNRIISMRHELPILVNNLIKQRGVKKLGTDVAVPNKFFADFYKEVICHVQEKGLEYVAFGHFGDSHLHLNIIPVNLAQMAEARKVYDYICLKAMELGGTFSAEHGVGKTKRHFLKSMVGDFNLKFMRNIKRVFDPNNILGRGNLFED